MTMTATQAHATGYGFRYLKVTAPRSDGSEVTFYWGDAPHDSGEEVVVLFGGFPIPISSNAPVQPVVQSWGAFTKELRGPDLGEVTLLAGVECAALFSDDRLTISDWMRTCNFMDATAELYQCSALETAGELIWSGYVSDVGPARYVRGEWTVELLLSNEQKALASTLIGDLVTVTTDPGASKSSIGMMPGRIYGHADGTLFGGSSNRNSPAYFGFPMPGYRGVVTDENESAVQVKIRFSKNDGTSAAHTFAEPTAGDPRTVGDLWVYDANMGAYGLVDGNSYSITNDTGKLEVLVDSSPRVYFFIKPSLKGTKNAAGFTNIGNLIDSDPSNYVESTSTDYIWAFLCPEVSVNGTIEAVGMVMDIDNVHPSKSRTVRWGLWDVFEATLGAGLLNAGAGSDISKPSGSSRSIRFLESGGGALFEYIASDFRNHNGRDTISEFKSGRFITADTSDVNEANLELYAEVLELGGADSGRDQVRLHGLSMYVQVLYPSVPKHNNYVWAGSGAQARLDESMRNADKYKGRERGLTLSRGEFRELRKFIDESYGAPAVMVRQSVLSNLVGTDFFARGVGQKDDGSGTFTGTPSGPITKPCDVARHILTEAGETVNGTAATLGNFGDARASGGVLNLVDDTLMPFGPRSQTVADANEILTTHFPMSLRKEHGSWHCIPDDLNPHSSRVYRSTSDEVWIGPDDIDAEDFECVLTPYESVQNSVIFKYAHGYPDREAAATYAYENPISQMYYGKKETGIIEEPWVIKHDLSAAVDTAPQAMAEWYGRRNGRQRLIVQAGLTQKFYDLKVGHVVEFRGLEDVGMKPFAYRCGDLDYWFQSASSTANQAVASAPLYVAASGTSKIYIGVSQQVSSFTANVSVAAAYTTVGAGDGSTAFSYMGIGGALTALTGVTNGNWLKSTGVQTVTFTRPSPWLVYKQELTFGSVQAGPCYWYTMDYNTATVTGTGSARTTHPAIWAGRRFEVVRTILPQASKGKYPKRRVVFQEVM